MPNSTRTLQIRPVRPVGTDVTNLAVNRSVPLLCWLPKDTQPGVVRAEVGSKKLIALGLQVSPVEGCRGYLLAQSSECTDDCASKYMYDGKYYKQICGRVS